MINIDPAHTETQDPVLALAARHRIGKWPFWLMVGLLFLTFLFLIQDILLPFVLGMLIAYFLHPLVDRLEKKGLPRGLAALIVLGCFFLGVALLSALIVPMLVSQLSDLISQLPAYATAFQQNYASEVSRWLGNLPIDTANNIKSAATNFSGEAVKLVEELLTGVFHSGIAIIHVLLLILVTPIVSFYLLRDWNDLVFRVDRLLPREHAAVIRQQLAVIDRTLAGFLRGQLNVCLIMAAYYGAGLTLAGLKFGAIIGIITGLLVVFPYVGLLLGLTIGLASAFFQFGDLSRILIVLAVFIAGGTLEGYIVTPRLVGGKVSLHPVWIIFGVLSGAALFGLVGALLAVPVTAVIGVLIRFAADRYVHSDYYRGTTLEVLEE